MSPVSEWQIFGARTSATKDLYIHICPICMYIYIYIHIHLYIILKTNSSNNEYTHTHAYVCIYIYIYADMEGLGFRVVGAL